MTKTVADAHNEIVRSVLERFPGAKTETMHFPSGAWSLDIRFAGEFFVVQWFPSEQRFGVSRARNDDLLFQPHDQYVATTKEAADLLRTLMTPFAGA